MLQLNGNFRIGFSQDCVTVEVSDEDASVIILTVQLTYEQFAQAVGSRYVSNIPVEFNNSGSVGSLLESKTELVPFDNSYSSTKEDIEKALAPFEVDGWEARKGDITNWHCSDKQGNQRVVFFRHVPKPEGYERPKREWEK